MPTDFFSPVDDAIDLPKRKFAAVFLSQLGEVSRRNRQKLGHESLSFSIHSVAYGAIALILDFTSCYDFHFLGAGGCRKGPYPANKERRSAKQQTVKFHLILRRDVCDEDTNTCFL